MTTAGLYSTDLFLGNKFHYTLCVAARLLIDILLIDILIDTIEL